MYGGSKVGSEVINQGWISGSSEVLLLKAKRCLWIHYWIPHIRSPMLTMVPTQPPQVLCRRIRGPSRKKCQKEYGNRMQERQNWKFSATSFWYDAPPSNTEMQISTSRRCIHSHFHKVLIFFLLTKPLPIPRTGDSRKNTFKGHLDHVRYCHLALINEDRHFYH